ncbi:class I SAM-dependent methyltransferase [Shewanella maritima]|uniref:class I SAM-dependent methyltransferase n=1 Tax=Shewanella maritima TaxID=2520507 RepID=UPI003735E4CD
MSDKQDKTNENSATALNAQDYLAINQQGWDSRVSTHVESRFYDVVGFKAGNSSLNGIELELLGDVTAKRMLHLQCHFGLDSLSWARLGAKVTGVDISPAAIAQAESLNIECQLDADFICSDVYQSVSFAKAEYDIAFTSYGALCWLPSMEQWAQTVAAHLKPGGIVYLVEFHPLHDVFDGYPYFHQQQPDIDVEGTYTENCDGSEVTLMTWAHPVSDVINALINAGLEIMAFNEYDYSPYPCFEGLVAKNHSNGQEVYQYFHQQQAVPLTYSIKARKK